MGSPLLQLILITAIITAILPSISAINITADALEPHEEELLKKSEHLEFIQRFYALVKKRCQIYFTADVLTLANQAFKECGDQRRFNYNDPDIEYPDLRSKKDMGKAGFPLDYDKCWHHCVLKKLYERTGSRRPAFLLTTNIAKEIQAIFHPDMSKIMSIEGIIIYKRCRREAVGYLASDYTKYKQDRTERTSEGIDELDPDYPCYLALFSWICINQNIDVYNSNKDSDTSVRMCLNSLDQKDYDKNGPPFL